MSMTPRDGERRPDRTAREPPPSGGSPLRWVLLGFFVLALVLGFLAVRGARQVAEVPISDVAEQVSQGAVRRVIVEGDSLRVRLADDTTQRSRKEPDQSLTEALRQYGVSQERIEALVVEVREPTDWSWLLQLLWFLPVLFLLIFFFSLRRGVAGGAGGMDQLGGFLRSRAREVSIDRPRVRFADVAAYEAAKQELSEIVEFLRQPERFTALGARVPRGVLLAGPPGTGKTLLARAVAGEASVTFLSINASEFVELFVGVGASRVRDLFQQARQNAPSIVFIDEIDAIGRRRGVGLGQTHEEREQTLNQILAEMDGFEPHASVVVMAATNRPDVLDPALLRPGRFDRRVTIDNPDRGERLAILRLHARGKPLEPDADLESLARATVGFSGADLENLLNEAALLAARRSQRRIFREDLEEAVDRVMAGPRRRGQPMSPPERELVAFHEAGHALVAYRLPYADPVHRVSIVSRGAAGGHTRVLPEEERRFWTRSQLRDTLAYTLGGLAAEELGYGEPTTGPGSDLEQASGLARRMVLEFGMSDELGPVALGRTDQEAMFGADGRLYSEQTAAAVDGEVRRLVGEARVRARETLADDLPILRMLAATLVERETLRREDLDQLLGPPASQGRRPTLRLTHEAYPEPGQAGSG